MFRRKVVSDTLLSQNSAFKMLSRQILMLMVTPIFIGVVQANIKCYNGLNNETTIVECQKPTSCVKAMIEFNPILTAHPNYITYSCGTIIEEIPICTTPHMSGCMTVFVPRIPVKMTYCCCGMDKCNGRENFGMHK